MRNVKIIIEYDGTNFSGWQQQPNGRTVQEEVVKALRKVTGEDIKVNGSGRTDAGVHAKGQVANFLTESSIPTPRIPLALNSLLPEDISILEATDVADDFHSRYSVIGKRYYYQVLHGCNRRPLLRNYSYHISKGLDLKLMKEASQLFIGEHDFKAFMSSGSSVTNTVRKINKIDFIEDHNLVKMIFSGNGFLYNMVRIMVGTLIEVGLNKRPLEGIVEALETGDRNLAGPTAPPQGLYLDKVFYPLTR
ncbi:tRNA pseudouridine(38-40) synthase TruA [Alkaliphilus serpentinus]|uniref:tRNA pseudouridine synthase A n=1 Tax=Alkaliphilus serpentinus TaxID=1482731 RepID=A0A833M7L9_9FIRM|nr:tRNA pseudouridine(38-40) synthase TruA [Alkaliphilus serpentinus]KAB3528858.1 tRNA pseudouridine(38-40) synthase TruA [Alkaliphilus serpentinus]